MTGKIGDLAWAGRIAEAATDSASAVRIRRCGADRRSRTRERTPVIRLRGDNVALHPAASPPAGSGADGQARNRQDARHTPHYVLLFLGRDDLFPFRIEYRRRDPVPVAGLEGATDKTIASMDLFEVRLNVPVSPTRFYFNPGKLEYSDQTDRFLSATPPQKT